MSNKNPLFLKFLNRETAVSDILTSVSRSSDPYTSKAAFKFIKSPPDLEDFRDELSGAVDDIIKEGLGEEFRVFVNHYMESSLEEDIESTPSNQGENVSRRSRVIDDTAPWVQAIICYNLTLYIKAFGMGELKKCRICGKIFAHKGKYAVYCSDKCKSEKTSLKNPPE